MWRNQEVLQFADWLRGHNASLAEGDRVSFNCLDVYSLSESIHAVLAYLDKVDANAAEIARQRYGCLTPWPDEPAQYGYRKRVELAKTVSVRVDFGGPRIINTKKASGIKLMILHIR